MKLREMLMNGYLWVVLSKIKVKKPISIMVIEWTDKLLVKK